MLFVNPLLKSHQVLALCTCSTSINTLVRSVWVKLYLVVPKAVEISDYIYNLIYIYIQRI